ncbi:hypothetical protein E2C01_053829 [Portunus trituberculatus]|uniref:Uncharacterized protein n=1 Tax=Portunus trituberculatus TaxID=210409 RepID=A0A5B7GI93_PORTR|nr:hypothetical protein [Portunus trituberculatus]
MGRLYGVRAAMRVALLSPSTARPTASFVAMEGPSCDGPFIIYLKATKTPDKSDARPMWNATSSLDKIVETPLKTPNSFQFSQLNSGGDMTPNGVIKSILEKSEKAAAAATASPRHPCSAAVLASVSMVGHRTTRDTVIYASI